VVLFSKGTVVNDRRNLEDRLRAAAQNKPASPAQPGQPAQMKRPNFPARPAEPAPARTAVSAPAASAAVARPAGIPGMTKPSGDKLANGFTAEESSLLHESIQLAKMRWLDGEGMVVAKSDMFEITFKPGESPNIRWTVMAFPLYDMNMPNAAEMCLHFLVESYEMIHMVDFVYQIGINMQTEKLEFLVQLPLEGVSAAQLSEMISTFFKTLSESVMNEMSKILEQLGAANAEEESAPKH
jgi:hypothetical protein